MSVYKSSDQLIGNTPLVRLNRIEKAENLKAVLLGKAESMNPAGCVKERIAKTMIDEAEAAGLLKPGALLVEASSGNTGIGLAMMAAARGYRLILTMPDTMSVERRQLLTAYGAELVLTDGALGMPGAMGKAEEIVRENPGSWYARQFENPANPRAHYQTTGPEIERDTKGLADILVAGVGTGGTITGAGRYLKERHPGIRIIAVEPSGSPVLSGGPKGKHKIQGIGAGFVPKVLDTDIYDQVITVSDEDAAEATRLLARLEGLLCGISSGAALHAAMTLAQKEENRGRNIVVILPDAGSRYLSGGLFGEA